MSSNLAISSHHPYPRNIDKKVVWNIDRGVNSPAATDTTPESTILVTLQDNRRNKQRPQPLAMGQSLHLEEVYLVLNVEIQNLAADVSTVADKINFMAHRMIKRIVLYNADGSQFTLENENLSSNFFNYFNNVMAENKNAFAAGDYLRAGFPISGGAVADPAAFPAGQEWIIDTANHSDADGKLLYALRIPLLAAFPSNMLNFDHNAIGLIEVTFATDAREFIKFSKVATDITTDEQNALTSSYKITIRDDHASGAEEDHIKFELAFSADNARAHHRNNLRLARLAYFPDDPTGKRDLNGNLRLAANNNADFRALAIPMVSTTGMVDYNKKSTVDVIDITQDDHGAFYRSDTGAQLANRKPYELYNRVVELTLPSIIAKHKLAGDKNSKIVALHMQILTKDTSTDTAGLPAGILGPSRIDNYVRIDHIEYVGSETTNSLKGIHCDIERLNNELMYSGVNNGTTNSFVPARIFDSELTNNGATLDLDHMPRMRIFFTRFNHLTKEPLPFDVADSGIDDIIIRFIPTFIAPSDISALSGGRVQDNLPDAPDGPNTGQESGHGYKRPIGRISEPEMLYPIMPPRRPSQFLGGLI